MHLILLEKHHILHVDLFLPCVLNLCCICSATSLASNCLSTLQASFKSSTVEPRLTTTWTMQPSHYHNHFDAVLRQCITFFLLAQPPWYPDHDHSLSVMKLPSKPCVTWPQSISIIWQENRSHFSSNCLSVQCPLEIYLRTRI